MLVLSMTFDETVDPVTPGVDGGVYVGIVEVSRPLDPRRRNSASLGMMPLSIIGSSRCHAAPSRPMTTARLVTSES
jgi:hypothetical protein